MLVTITFEKEGKKYKVERGRKPNIMKYFIDDQEQELSDVSQGDSRKTQEDLNKMIGMTPRMFKHLVALNTYTQPFLALHHSEQQDIIEQLLGIQLLSEKADILKTKIKRKKMVPKKRPLLSPAHLCSFRLYSERCLSGLKSTLGKRVYALKRTEGSNPSLSAIIKRIAEGSESPEGSTRSEASPPG